MDTPSTPRARARAATIADAKRLALAQLAEAGAAELSLRAIARDLGMVSSAIYRYFRSRDELLTALIVDAYDDLADAVTAADRDVEPDAYRARWTVAAHAFRDWARAEPHRFALLYGSPVPGYHAPETTVAPAVRVMTAFTGIVDSAATSGRYADRPLPEPTDAGLVADLERTATLLAAHTPPAAMARATFAFAQLVGMVSLELGGHFVGGFEPADALFSHAVSASADSLHLEDLAR